MSQIPPIGRTYVEGQGAHRFSAAPKAGPLKGAPNAVSGPTGNAARGTPVEVVWHVAVFSGVEAGAELEGGVTGRGVALMTGADGFVVRPPGGGLRPPTPISVEPIGMPTGPTAADDPRAVPDEPIGADPAAEPPPLVAQGPIALPVTPLPSNSAVGAPADAPADEAPHVTGAIGDTPDINGLRAGAGSSVVPMGIPVRATGGVAPMPSGDVTPSGGPGAMLIPPTWA